MDEKKLYYFSIICALSIYSCFILFFVGYRAQSKVKSYDAIAKTTTIYLDVVLNNKKTNSIEQSNVQKKITQNKKVKIKKSVSKTNKVSSNIKSLFNNVNTKKDVIIKKSIIDNIKKSITNSKFKSKFEKEKKSDNLNISKHTDNNLSSSNKSAELKSDSNKDPYISNIYEDLTNKWNNYPTTLKDKFATVLITIANNGIFNYSFIQYSDDEIYNKQLIKFLDTQKKVTFPSHDKGLMLSMQMTFKIINK